MQKCYPKKKQKEKPNLRQSSQVRFSHYLISGSKFDIVQREQMLEHSFPRLSKNLRTLFLNLRFF